MELKPCPFCGSENVGASYEVPYYGAKSRCYIICFMCNARSCDDFWSSGTAIVCCQLIVHIRKKPFWKREKVWRKVNADLKVEEKYVKPTDAKIKELANER